MHIGMWWYFYNNDPADIGAVLHSPNKDRFDFHLNPGGSRMIGLSLRDEPIPFKCILVSCKELPIGSQFAGMKIYYNTKNVIKGEWGDDILFKPTSYSWFNELPFNINSRMGDVYADGVKTGYGLGDKKYNLVLYDGSVCTLNHFGKTISGTYYASNYGSFFECVRAMFKDAQQGM